jgi:hypothetical protein
MKDKNTPAFPHIDSGLGRFEQGMTLRDYFAAKAMALAYKVNKERNDANFGPAGWNFDVKDVEYIASVAYDFADAMMEARDD